MSKEDEIIENKSDTVSDNKKKKTRVTIIICSIAFILLVIMVAVFFIFKDTMLKMLAAEREEAEIKAVLDVDTIYTNVYVENVNIGGLTKDQALALLNSHVLGNLDSLDVTYKYNNLNYNRTFTFRELGVEYNLNEAVDKAYSFGRDESLDLYSRYAIVMENKDRGNYIDANWTYDDSKVEACVDLICKDIDTDAVDADYKYNNGNVTVTESKTGHKVDRDRAISMTKEVLPIGKSAEINLLVENIEPKYKKEDLQFTSSEIGSFTSAFGGGDQDRITNLGVACDKINNSVIMPGETFSANAAMSPFTEANGYKYAGAYVGGKLVEDIGGGVCQVSSALYNAALKAELEIAERYNHSKKVGYLDYGYDATLAGDVKDLKIKNNTGYPVALRAYIENGAVVVKVIGYEAHDSGRTLEFYNEKTGQTDGTISYDLYKKVYENGSLVDTVKINSSTYNTK